MKKTSLAGIGITIIGIVFIVISFFIYDNQKQFSAKAVEKEATVESVDYDNLDEEYDVTVSFEVDGQVYRGVLDEHDEMMIEGEKITIYYDPNNPSDFRSSNSFTLAIIFGIIGVVIAILGIAIAIKSFISSKNKEKIMAYNFVIQANISGLDINNKIAINGKNPYVLATTYVNPNDGKMYTYKSENIWQDVAPIIQNYNITTIPVYVNPKNYNEYYIDLSFITKYLGN